jgi:hypothetical protein
MEGHRRRKYPLPTFAAGAAAIWRWRPRDTPTCGCLATVNFLPSFISVDTFNCDAFLADASGLPLPGAAIPPAAPAGSIAPGEQAADPWTAQFTQALQAQHTRVREFLETQRERWREVAAHFTREIETLQVQVQELQGTNEGLRQELAQLPEREPAEKAPDPGDGDRATNDEVRELKARNASLQRQLLDLQSSAAGRGAAAAAPAAANNWETQKRKLLANLATDDPHDSEATERRLKIEEIVARTDKIIAEKNCEIEELKYLLDHQSSSLGSLAVGAEALGQIFDQDAVILEERQRLQQLQDETQAKLRAAEIEIAMERARLARREAEIEEKILNNNLRQSTAEAESEALAPTGRPIRGRWRTQLGLTDDQPESENRRDQR